MTEYKFYEVGTDRDDPEYIIYAKGDILDRFCKIEQQAIINNKKGKCHMKQYIRANHKRLVYNILQEENKIEDEPKYDDFSDKKRALIYSIQCTAKMRSNQIKWLKQELEFHEIDRSKTWNYKKSKRVFDIRSKIYNKEKYNGYIK